MLGEVYQKEINTTTDSDQVTSLERTVKITSIIPCPHTCYFYNGIGIVDVDRIRTFLGDHFLKVVGWYKFKHYTGFDLTLHEKLIHKQLLDKFQIPTDLFTTCLLTTSRTDNHSTHAYSQTFIRYKNFKYQQLPMQIINLTNPSNSVKHNENTSKAIKELLSSLNLDLNKSQGLVVTREIHNALQRYIDELPSKSANIEKQVYELEQEIKQCRETLKWKRECSSNLLEAGCNENGTSENISSENSPSNSLESSPETGRKTRIRTKSAKQNLSKKTDDSPLKSETITENGRITRSQTSGKIKNNFSYSQAAQARKN